MVGEWTTVTKPSRSDEVLDADQQLKMTNQIRAQFDSMAPKRPTKPNRSEPDSTNNNNNNNQSTDENIPELDKLRSLQSQSHVLFPGEGANMVPDDEFVETHYYNELVSVDKVHHTTGSGFISVVNEGNGYNINVGDGLGGGERPVYKSNPATNDWVPSVEYDQAFISSKPNRSEGC